MRRRSFLGLLAGAVVAPAVKADTQHVDGSAWALDVYQTPNPLPRPIYDCYLSDFGPRVIIKRA